MAIIYGTLYMMFSAFPIVYQENRGWSQGVGGLAFIGVAIGMLGAVIYTIPDNKRYQRVAQEATAAGAKNGASPEARLPPSLIGSICLPIGLFWFAWTNYPSIHWIVSIIGTVPFGFGMVLVFLSIMNYLIDAYTIYAASVLAANSVLRSLFGAVFPLFTTQMYNNLGIHWASTIPAFLALMCVPFPFLFYKYGARIRRKCKFAREAEDTMARIMKDKEKDDGEESEEAHREKAQVPQTDPKVQAEEMERQREASRPRARTASSKRTREVESFVSTSEDGNPDLEKGERGRKL
ncbi:MFS siderochrome iron transporter 1 [Ptychographa xylographoides]|nr:MFS siderochrome iron transporter 1 [Ptychographa xylographoides]